MKTFSYTVLALVAFAGNSVLCRLALGSELIDAMSFSAIRLLSGTVILWLVVLCFYRKVIAGAAQPSKGSWLAAVMLFIYVVTFSFAYLSLDTGVGALVLFTIVQVTIVVYSLFSGKYLSLWEWLGLLLALCGFVYLFLPSLSEPTLMGFILMSMSGIAWAAYTLKGRNSAAPLFETLYNFTRTLPLLIIFFMLASLLYVLQTYTVLEPSEWLTIHWSATGVWLAVASGAITSALGYFVWYVALKSLSNIQAGVVQLLVPLIAAIGGVIFSNELISLHILKASAIILSGVLFVIFSEKLQKGFGG